MPTKYCFLCASDEGVFLDVTTENKQTFCTQFKICSLVKAPTSDQLPTKICHKCAYELNQCSTFLEKYKKAAKSKSYNQRKCCSLCFEQRSREYTFDLSKENTLELKSINKIQEILNNKANTVQKNNIIVCLFCRYTVDVLCDLKNLSNGVASKLDNKLGKDIDYSSFPKIKTTVISRKTTITESARATLKPKQNTENESYDMIRTRSKLNAKDIGAQNPSETKVCKVFLKDVLTQKAAKKVKQVNETEKDVENKGKQKATGKRLNLLSTDTESDIKKQPEKRPIKSANINDSDNTDIPNKKTKRGLKETVKELEPSPPIEPVQGRLTRNRKATANDRHVAETSDSDNPLSINNVKELKGPLTKHKKITGTSLSDADVEIKSDRKQLKSILTGNTSLKGSDANDESLTDDGASKKKKLRFNSDEPIYIDLTTTSSNERERSRKNVTKRVAVRGRGKKIGRSSLVKKSPQNSELGVETESTSEEEIKTYSCEECGINYENKLLFLTHKLTHCKQLKLELEKVAVESKPNAVSEDTSEAIDEQSEDQLEAIRITVDDDEEEGELESNNLDSSVDANLSNSRVEEVAASPEIAVSSNSSLATPKDTLEPEVSSKELGNNQPTEKDDKDKKSLRGQRSRSVSASTDKASAENVEDIPLANIVGNQEEEREKEVDRESERKEKAEEEVAGSEDATVDAVAEEKEAEDQDKEKPKETISKEKLGGDVDVDKLDSSEKIEADKTQGDAKLDSSEGSEEKNDTALLENPEENHVEENQAEENQVEKEERRNSSNVVEENLNEKENSELSDKSAANLVDDNLDSADKFDKVRPIEKDKTDSSSKSEERRVTRTNKSVTFATLEGKGKQGSPENSREKSSSPDKSEGRKLSKKNKSSLMGRSEEDKRESSETSEETDKLGTPVRSEERKSTRKTRSSPLRNIEEDKSEKSKEKDKSVSPVRTEERKSTRKTRSSLLEKVEEEKSEKFEGKDKLGSPTRSEERKSTRKTRSSPLGNIEEDKPEKCKGKDKLGSPVRSDERKSTRKTRFSFLGKIEEDKQDSPENSEEKDRSGSPVRSEERKSMRKRKAEEDKQDSLEKSEGKDRSSSPAKSEESKRKRKVEEDKKDSPEKLEEEESEEKKVNRNKSKLNRKSEEKDKQDSSETSKDETVSSEKLDEDESEENKSDKSDGIIEINDDDSTDSIKEVCENKCNNEIDVNVVEEVEVMDLNDDTSSDVEEVCEKIDDQKEDEDEDVQCVETSSLDKSSNKKSNDAQRNDEDIVEVDASTQPMPTSDSADAVSEILQLVLDLASTEIQKRQDSTVIIGEDDSDDAETLENISREVQSGGDTRP